MKILCYADLYKPDHAGGAAIYTDFCEAAAARGHHVTVRCAFPYFPEWVDKSGRNGWRIWRHLDGGVHVEHHGQVLPTRRSTLQRLLYEASNFGSLLRSTFRGRHDVVLVFSTRYSSLAAGAVTAVLRRRPLCVSVQDISSVAATATGYSQGKALAWLVSHCERWALRRARAVVTIAPGMVDALADLDPSLDPQLVPNWANRSMVDRLSEVVPARKLDPGCPRLLYAGNIGMKQGLLDLCRLLHGLDRDFMLRIHASGPGAAEIETWLETVQDPRFELGPFLPEPEFLQRLAEADLCLICELPSSGNAYMPSKLIPALLVGTPILAVCDPEGSLGREVSAQGLGRVVPWELIDETLVELDADEWATWASAGASRAQAYLPEPRIEELLALLQSISSTPRP